MNYKLNDIVIMKNICFSCGENAWKIIRMGADIRIKCIKCGKSILLGRFKFNEELQKIDNPKDNSHTIRDKLPSEIKDIKIGDEVKLKEGYRCKNYQNHNRTIWFPWSRFVEEWIVEEINSQIVLKCKECGEYKILSFDSY